MTPGAFGGAVRWVAAAAALGWCVAAPCQERVAAERGIDSILKLLGDYHPDPARTRKFREAAAARPPQSDDPGVLARFYQQRGQAARRAGDFFQAREDLRESAGYAERAQGVDLAGILQNLGATELFAGDYFEGMRIRERALALNPPARRGRNIDWNLYLSNNYLGIGDLERARKSLNEAEAHYRLRTSYNQDRYWHDYWAGELERARGRLLAHEGKYPEAISAFRRMIEICERDMAMRPGTAATVVIGGVSERTHWNYEQGLQWYAEALAKSGDLAQADYYARRAVTLTLSRSGDRSPESASQLTAMILVLAERGRFDEAVLLSNARIAFYTDLHGGEGLTTRLSDAYAERAQLHAATENWQAARRDFESALQVFSRSNAGERTSSIGREPAYALALLGTQDPRAAAVARQAALDRAQRFGNLHLETAIARATLGLALTASGERDGAAQAFRESVPQLVERTMSGVREGALARRLKYLLEGYLRFLIEAGDAQGVDVPTETFRVADALRSGPVQRDVAAVSARLALADAQLALLARTAQDGARESLALQDLLAQRSSLPPAERNADLERLLRERIERLESEGRAAQQRLRREAPRFAELSRPAAPTPQELARMLAPGEVFIAIYPLREQALLWAVRGGQPAVLAVSKLSSQRIAETVSALRHSLNSAGRLRTFDVAAAHELYSGLIAPLEPAWRGARTLIVSAPGVLGQIPFALLPSAPQSPPADGSALFDRYRKVKWLMRDVAVAHVPSASTLIALRSMPAASASRAPFAGFGDPAFGPASRPVHGEYLQVSGLAALPDTRDELLAIARALGADSAKDIYLGAEATERRVKQLDLSQRRVIAFATHGLLPGEVAGLEQPALALTPPQKPDSNDDGMLTLEEVLGLRMDADWVVLSACNTAAADGAGAEAVSGLGRGFFYAGSRSLLVTHWAVETRSARRLVSRIFERYGADTAMTRAEALRRAMLDLLDEGDQIGGVRFSYAHPMFWAPYALIGDPGR